ncbi:MAG: carbon monoxide dehydrogenase maturation protein, partial [Cyanobacteria bacterium J06643_5]
QVEAFEAEHQDKIVGKIPFIPTIYGKNPLEVFSEIEGIFTPMVEKILAQKLSSPQQRWQRVLRWQERLQQQMEIKKSQSLSFIS